MGTPTAAAEAGATAPHGPVLTRTTRLAALPVNLSQITLSFLLASLGPYVLLLAAELDRDPAQLGWLSSAFGLGLLIVAVTGPAIMRIGAGATLRFAAVSMIVGAGIAATTPTVPAAGTGALLTGLGCAVVVLATPALLRGPTAAARITRVTALASCAAVSAPLLLAAVESVGAPGRLALLLPAPLLLVVAIRPSMLPLTGLAGHPPPADAGEMPIRFRVERGRIALLWTLIVLAVAAEFCFLIWGAARLRQTGVAVATAAALSFAFLVGMAAGRLLGPKLFDRGPVFPVAGLTAVTGAVMVSVFPGTVLVTAGLALAGLGISVLYPVSLARLTAVPGLGVRHSASLGALASGVAVLTAPAVLAAVTGVVSLRVAFLLPAVLLVALFLLARRASRAAR